MQNRYDFIYLFDVRDGNPNGDPDAGNLPRVDAETGHGLVTDVCLKRKIRNYVQLRYADRQQQDAPDNQAGFDIYVREKAVLNDQHARAHRAVGVVADDKSKRKGSADQVDLARQWMCRNFYDVRTFGAVMSLGINCGQVRGPVQFTFGRSIDPVIAAEHSITRMAVATKEEEAKQGGDNRTMGRKFTIPYGLYRTHGFVSAPLARQTGFSEEDLELLWQALEQMFEHDRSASRGEMAARGLLLFRHDNAMGHLPAHGLFDRVTLTLAHPGQPARSFQDYLVHFDGRPITETVAAGQSRDLGSGVTLLRRI